MKNREEAADFFQKALGYTVQQEFSIDFGRGRTARCIALEPPEKQCPNWKAHEVFHLNPAKDVLQEYHMPPEVFVSDGNDGSVVGDWVAARNGVGGVHHIAYQVDSVEDKMAEWLDKGYAEFASKEPMRCDGLVQVFTKPSLLTGVVYEFIERAEYGFCRESVKELMLSSQGG